MVEHNAKGTDSQVALVVKNPPANAGDVRRGFNPWVRKIPWRREWKPTSVYFQENPHGQRSLAGHGPWGHEESDMSN